jgi:hypothetical protein
MADDFRLGVGGPLYRLERAAHLDRPGGLIAAAIGLTWVPLLVLSLIENQLGAHDGSILRDFSIDARLLVTLPLLLFADRLLDLTCSISVRRLFEEGYVPPDQCDRVRRILHGAERWRDSWVPEAVLLTYAFVTGVLSLAGVIHPAGIVHGVVELRHGPARVWYALVSLPLGHFILDRSLLRWGLWVRVLIGLSRTPLRLTPMHGDQRGGIGFLKLPSLAFGAVLLLGLSSVQWGAWANQIQEYGLKLETLKPLFFVYVLVALVIVLGPLLAFVPMLLTARTRSLEAYGGLMSDYARQIDDRWIAGHERADLLGRADFQSLADLRQSYQDAIEKMNLVLFDVRDVTALLVFALLPALPGVVILAGPGEAFSRLVDIAVGRLR